MNAASNFFGDRRALGQHRHMASASLDGAGRGKPTRAALPVRPPGTARSILRGEIENVGLPTLLTILDMERRSGLLLIQRQKTLGRLHVREGRVVRARIEGANRTKPGQTGAEAVYEMLAWTDGQFELWQAVVEGRDEVGSSTTFLLMENARRIDQSAHELSGGGASMAADAW
jgi:hypothetical protein